MSTTEISTTNELSIIASSIIGRPIAIDRSSGSSGVAGDLFERQWGVETNSRSEADCEHGELKTSSIDTQSMTSLFCIEPDTKNTRQMVDVYGEDDPYGRRRLSLTLYGDKYNSRGFGLRFDDDRITIVHEDGMMFNCSWTIDRLYNRFKKKFPKRLLKGFHNNGASAVTFLEIRSYAGLKDKETILNLIKTGKIVIEMTAYFYSTSERIGRGGARVLRNRGVKVRTHHVSDLFDSEQSAIVV